MTTLSPMLHADLIQALTDAGRTDLVARLRAAEAPALLTSAQAAAHLGLSSPNTVKNWLAGGAFPGAFRTRGGHWRFPREEVEEVKRRMDALRALNQAGTLAPPPEEDDGPLPLL